MLNKCEVAENGNTRLLVPQNIGYFSTVLEYLVTFHVHVFKTRFDRGLLMLRWSSFDFHGLFKRRTQIWEMLPICEQLQLNVKWPLWLLFPLLMLIFSQHKQKSFFFVCLFFSQSISAKLSPCFFQAIAAVYISPANI